MNAKTAIEGFSGSGKASLVPCTRGTEDVITALGRFSNLLVISKSATFPFKNSNVAPAEIGRLLNARYLLDGSIRRAGNRVRVGVSLTEPTTGRNVWSETYDVEGDDIFAVQDNIAKRVVGAAAVKLTRVGLHSLYKKYRDLREKRDSAAWSLHLDSHQPAPNP